MDAQVLIVNPQIRILYRNRQLFAVQLSRTKGHFPILEDDLALLWGFLEARAPTDVSSALVLGPLGQQTASVPSLSEVKQRIAQMVHADVLLPGHRAADDLMACDRLTLQGCEGEGADSHHDSSILSCELKLSKSLALRPTRAGFAIWSAVERSHLLLDLPLVRLLYLFAEGRTAQQLIDGPLASVGRHIVANAVRVLTGRGLLVRVRKHASLSAAIRRVVKPQPLGPRALRWEDMSADGRVPIYFNPHMENHYPLALGMMRSAIEAYDSGALLEAFQPIPITHLLPQDFLRGPYRKFGPGVWLFSNYIWNVPYNLKISEAVKSHNENNICIHGGPSTPSYKASCTQFMRKNPSVAAAVHGEGEASVVELLRCIAPRDGRRTQIDFDMLRNVAGITFVDPAANELVWTAPRTRISDLDAIPSPYLTGVFDAYQGRVEAAIIETNRGCPFGCTFCDWGSATRQKVRKFDLERVREEIELISRREIRVLWIADANFGMYDRDIEISKMIVDAKSRLGYPREVVVNYTKNTNKRLIEIVRILSRGGIISQGIISIQTTDEATLEVINRRNIKTETYDELTRVFAEADLPLSTDLMIGLPGITVDAWDRDLQRYFDIDVAVKAYRTRLLPNSPMADPDYMLKYRIEVDEKDFIVACHSFTRKEREAMEAIYDVFTWAESFGLLRYVLRYLQWDHDIRALNFLHRLLDVTRADPARYPTLTWVGYGFLHERTAPGGWHGFYRELAAFIEAEFSISESSALSVALEVNEMVMPDDTLGYPLTRRLEHDFAAWFAAHKSDSSPRRHLSDYPPGTFTVDDPDLTAHIDMDNEQYDCHQYFWELRSVLCRSRSAAEVAHPVEQSAGSV